MIKEPDTQRGLLKKAGLVGVTLAGIIFGSLGVSGCGKAQSVQIGSGLPAKRQVQGIMQEEYDRKMEQLKGEYQEEMRIQRIITPSNDSVNGYLPLGRVLMR